MKRPILRSARGVELVRPRWKDREEFLRRVRDSRALHRSWVAPPCTESSYREYLRSLHGERKQSMLLRLRPTGRVAGVFTRSEIVRGVLQSAYLGFYAFVPFNGSGHMTAGLRLLRERAVLPSDR